MSAIPTLFCIDDNPRYLPLLRVAVRSLRKTQGADAPCLYVYAGDNPWLLDSLDSERIPCARYTPSLDKATIPQHFHRAISAFLKLELALLPELADTGATPRAKGISSIFTAPSPGKPGVPCGESCASTASGPCARRGKTFCTRTRCTLLKNGKRRTDKEPDASIQDIAHGVDLHAVEFHLVMQVRPRRAARTADKADNVAAFHLLAFTRGNALHMRVLCGNGTAVLYFNAQAVRSVSSGEYHRSLARGDNRRAGTSADIKPFVKLDPP